METFVQQLLGPMGGVAALGFGIGCAAGYTFGVSRVAKLKLDAVVEPLKIRLEHLQEEVTELKETVRQKDELIQQILKKVS
jgi:hypothetical protein